ncbi:MAG: hypothetical protein ACOCP8_03370 [archaeon]
MNKMSTNVGLNVYNIKLKQLRENKEDIIQLMKYVNFGKKEERVKVAEYITEKLLDRKTSDKITSAYWNYHPRQDEIKDYDCLVEYFKMYGKILSQKIYCFVYITADYKNPVVIYGSSVWELQEEEKENAKEFIEKLEMKKKVKEGKKTKEKIKN